MSYNININRSDKHSGVDAAVSFDDMARYHEVILFEREARMPSWQLNKDVVCHRIQESMLQAININKAMLN